METVGAYAFITSDWKEKDFPLDLWLEHHLQIFDQIALVTYGEMKIDSHPKLKIKEMPPVNEKRFSFYIIGKSEAQQLLDTDWKILLDVDEFIPFPINTSVLDKKFAYALRYHNLYGNIQTEIDNEFPKFQYRLHYGNRAVLGDGGNVKGPIAEKYSFAVADTFKAVMKKIFRKLIPSIDKYLVSKPIFLPEQSFEVWHTGATRNPKALSEKWRVQITREISEGYKFCEGRLKWLDTEGFDYKAYKIIWPNSRILRVDPEELPEILKKNEKRFGWVKFDDREYSDR